MHLLCWKHFLVRVENIFWCVLKTFSDASVLETDQKQDMIHLCWKWRFFNRILQVVCLNFFGFVSCYIRKNRSCHVIEVFTEEVLVNVFLFFLQHKLGGRVVISVNGGGEYWNEGEFESFFFNNRCFGVKRWDEGETSAKRTSTGRIDEVECKKYKYGSMWFQFFIFVRPKFTRLCFLDEHGSLVLLLPVGCC